MQHGDRGDVVERRRLERVGHEVAEDELDVLVQPAGQLDARRVAVDARDERHHLAQLAGEQALAATDVEGAPAARRNGPEDQRVVVRVVIPPLGGAHRVHDFIVRSGFSSTSEGPDVPPHDLALSVAAVAGVAGCGNTPERLNARQQRNVDRTPPEVYAMPDHYNNVASKCDGHGHRMYVTSNKDQAPSNLVVVSDESCSR